MFNRNRVTRSIFLSRSVSLSLVVSAATLLPTFSALSSQEDNLDVYPPNWWTDMQHPEVELMIFGNDVADDKVFVSKGSVQIKQSRALDSENYLFVTLDLADANPQELVLTLKDEDEKISSALFRNRSLRLRCTVKNGMALHLRGQLDQ